MAIRFMVIFDVDDDAPIEDVRAAFEKGGELLREIPQVKALQGGLNLNPNASHRKWGFTVDFDSREDMQAYVAHDNHAAALTAIRPYNKSATNALIEI